MIHLLLIKVLNMSLTASIVILLILLARLVIRRAPKLFSYLLWMVVLFRLLCPVSLSVDISFFNIIDMPTTHSSNLEFISPNTSFLGTPNTDSTLTNVLKTSEEVTLSSYTTLKPELIEVIFSIAPYLWVLGFFIMLIYSVLTLLKLHRKLIGATPLRANIYVADYITSPFVLGVFHPKIYIPSLLSSKEQEYLLLHEQYHLRRFDHVVKLLFFLALCIHWFNPLVWIAFILLGKDMEMSCDEAVLARIGDDIRVDYSISLLNFATGHRIISNTPLAFGEGDTKSRIKNVLSWKKPSVRVTLLAAATCIILILSFALNPKTGELFAPEPFGHTYRVADVTYSAPQYSFVYTPETAPQYCLTSDYVLMVKNDLLQANDTEDWQQLGSMSEVVLTQKNFDRYILGGTGGWIGNETVEQFRKHNRRAYQLIMKNDPNQVSYYVLLQKNGNVYLSYGYNFAADQTKDQSTASIRWIFQMNRIDGISVTVKTNGQETYCEPGWYPTGQFDFNYDALASAVIYEEGSLIISVNEDSDTLIVGEDYYNGAGRIEKETYTLNKNENGNFILDIRRRQNIKDEFAVYYIPYDEGLYVFQIMLPTSSD